MRGNNQTNDCLTSLVLRRTHNPPLLSCRLRFNNKYSAEEDSKKYNSSSSRESIQMILLPLRMKYWFIDEVFGLEDIYRNFSFHGDILRKHEKLQNNWRLKGRYLVSFWFLPVKNIANQFRPSGYPSYRNTKKQEDQELSGRLEVRTVWSADQEAGCRLSGDSGAEHCFMFS